MNVLMSVTSRDTCVKVVHVMVRYVRWCVVCCRVCSCFLEWKLCGSVLCCRDLPVLRFGKFRRVPSEVFALPSGVSPRLVCRPALPEGRVVRNVSERKQAMLGPLSNGEAGGDSTEEKAPRLSVTHTERGGLPLSTHVTAQPGCSPPYPTQT